MATVTVEVVGEVRKLKASMDQANGYLGKLSSATRTAGTVMAGSFAADAIGAGVSALADRVRDAGATVTQQADLAAQTQAVLASTGAAAGISADKVTALADAIESKSQIDGEAIVSGQNLLLTFTNVKDAAGSGNDVFSQTTQLMADMSTAMGQDTKTSAIQLGKALNDPIKGVGALSKVGVSFTAGQKEQITTLQKSGDMMGAQKIILAELGKEFGGSAAKSAQTFGGQMFQLQDAIDTVIENGLKAIMPWLSQAVAWFQDKLPAALATLKTWLSQAQQSLAPLAGAIGAVIGFMRDNPAVVQAFAITLGVLGGALGIVAGAQWIWNAAMAANPIGLIVIGIAALVAAIVWLVTNWDTVTASVGRFVGQVTGPLVAGLQSAVKWVADTVAGIGAWFGRLWATATTAGREMAAGIGRGVGDTVAWITGLPGRAWAALATFASQLVRRAADGMDAMCGAVADGITDLGSWISGIPDRVLGWLGGLGGLLVGAGRSIMDGFGQGLRDSWDGLTGWIGGIADWIRDHKGPLSKDRVLLRPAGRAIMAGLRSAMADELPGLGRTLATITDTISGGLSPTLSPSVAALGPAGAISKGAGSSGPGTVINVTVAAPVGSSPVEIGRELATFLNAYYRSGGRR